MLVGSQLLSSGGAIINVSSYADHPNYSSNTNRFDAAVLQLSTSGDIAAGGEPLQLIGAGRARRGRALGAGKMLAISGWG